MNESEKKSIVIAKNSFYNAIKTLASILFPLITFPYVSRVLHAENIGKINFGNSIVSYFSLIASLGISVYAIRECAKVKDNRKELSQLASQLYSINIVTMCISCFILVLTLFSIKKLSDYRLLILIQGLSIPFGVIGTDWINAAMEDFKFITIRTCVFQFIALILMFCFVHAPSDYIIYAIVFLISVSGANLVNIFYRKKFCKISFTCSVEWKKHVIPVLTLFAMLVFSNIMGNLDTTMLGFMKTDKDVGLYSTSRQLINVVNRIVDSITWVILPQLSYTFSHSDEKGTEDILNKALSYTIVLGLPLLVGVNFLAPQLLHLIGGEEFVAASLCCRILNVNMFFSFLGNLYGNLILLPSGNEKLFLISCIVGTILNISTNALFIPSFGINGAAMTTALCGLVVSIILIIASWKKTRISYRFDKKLFLAPMIGMLVEIGIIIFCKIVSNFYIVQILLSVGISIPVYLIILIIFKYKLIIELIDFFVNRFKKI